MDEQIQSSPPTVTELPVNDPAPRKRRWGIIKILLSLVLTVGVFATGVAVGKGNLHVNGLSKVVPKQSASSTSLDYSSVDQVYNLLKSDFDGTLDNTKLLDGAKSGLVNAGGDPYTEYFNPKDAKEFNQELSGSFIGIGAELGTDSSNNIVIVSPLAGYPADQAGLRPKDVIAAVDGQSTSGWSINAAVRKIRGEAGTKVTLTIIRGNAKPFEVSVNRAQITLPSVKTEVNGQVGYLKITQFTDDTVSLAQKAANDFKGKGLKGVVLDLRSNPGGFLSGAVDISSLWLDKGQTVVSERRGSTIVDTSYAKGNNLLKGLPTVVLIDGGSASASEITAGALRDNKAATIVGAKSFGKGSVQEVKNLNDGSELKITIARWYTPGGKNIDKQGITPDVAVTISDTDAKAGKDPQKDKAFELVNAKIK